MSANGKSCEDGGGGEDADDEDVATGNSKATGTSAATKPSSEQKTTVAIKPSLESKPTQNVVNPQVPLTNQPILQAMLQQQDPAVHPHMPQVIPSRTGQNRPSPSTIQSHIPLNKVATTLHKPKQLAGKHPVANFPPTISIPSPPHGTDLPAANHPPQYNQPHPSQTHHVVPTKTQVGPPPQQYQPPPQHMSPYVPQGQPSPYSYTHQQPQQQASFYPPPTQPPQYQSPTRQPTPHEQAHGPNQGPTPHEQVHGPNQGLLNPSANAGYSYPTHIQPKQPQPIVTSPQQANQGLLTPNLSAAHPPYASPYPQQRPHSQYTQPAPQHQKPPGIASYRHSMAHLPSYHHHQSESRELAIQNTRVSYPQGPPAPSDSLPRLPPNAPQGSFFNPAAAAFSQGPQPQTLPQQQSTTTGGTPEYINKPSTAPNAPVPGSNRIMELQNELLFKKKKELWKYKRKKKKKADEGNGTGTEDSQDSQEDSGSVNSGNESVTGGTPSSASTPLPHQASVVGQHQIASKSGPPTLGGTTASLQKYQGDIRNNELSSNNLSMIVNKPSTSHVSQQHYGQPTSVSLQLRNVSDGTRPRAPSSNVASGWQQQPLPIASSSPAMHPQMISKPTQQQVSPSYQYSSGQYASNYPHVGDIRNNVTQPNPSPYNTYMPPPAYSSYPSYQRPPQQSSLVMSPRSQPRIQNIPPLHPTPMIGQGGSRLHYPYPTQPRPYEGGVGRPPSHLIHSNQPPRYATSSTGVRHSDYGFIRPQNSQHIYTPPNNGAPLQPIPPTNQIMLTPQCSKEHTYGLCDLCGYCGPPPPATATVTSSNHGLSNGANCIKTHGEGLCSECGYVGISSSNNNSPNNKSKDSELTSKPFDQNYDKWPDSDSSEDSDSSDGYTSFYKNRKSINTTTTHAQLVAALTKKKPGRPRQIKYPSKIQPSGAHSTPPRVDRSNINQDNKTMHALFANKSIPKPPKRATSLSSVKFHRAHTIDLMQEFQELEAELEYMEKTDKMHPTAFRSYGPKGTFDKSSGKIQTANVVPVAKKTLTESVKTINKKLEEEDSDFTASEDESEEESSDTISEQEEGEEESSEDAPIINKRRAAVKQDEESSEDAPIITKRRTVASEKSIVKKNKYEYDSDYSVSKEDLKMMKSLKRSTARLENPDYESEEESEESEDDNKNDSDWFEGNLSEEETPLRKRKSKGQKISPRGYKPKKIRGEDLSIDMNVDYNVSSSRLDPKSSRSRVRTHHYKGKKKEMSKAKYSDEDENDSDFSKRQHKRFKSRKCREESSDESSATETEDSSSSSETGARKRKNLMSAKKTNKGEPLKPSHASNSKEGNQQPKEEADEQIESDASKTFDEYESELEEGNTRRKKYRNCRRHGKKGYKISEEPTKLDLNANNHRFKERMRWRCRPYLLRNMLSAFRMYKKQSNTKKESSSYGAIDVCMLPKVVVEKIDENNIAVIKENENNLNSVNQEGEENLVLRKHRHSQRNRKMSDSSSDSSLLSIDDQIASDTDGVDSTSTTTKARRSLNFSEVSSSNDTPQRSRSPKRKGTSSRPEVVKPTQPREALALFKENGYDEGDESERSIQEARSPKRSSKAGIRTNRCNNNVTDVNDLSSALQTSNLPLLGGKGKTKRGKPEPSYQSRNAETKETEEHLPWLLRESPNKISSSGHKKDADRILKNAFNQNPCPSMQELIDLESKTEIPTKQIIYWFQQTRKEKRKEEKLKILSIKEATYMGIQNKLPNNEKKISDGTIRSRKRLKKSSSSQSLFSVGGADSDSSSDFRGFESDSNLGNRRLSRKVSVIIFRNLLRTLMKINNLPQI